MITFLYDKNDKNQPCQSLHVQRRQDPAEEATLTMPDMLTSLGSQSWMKNRVPFYCIFLSLHSLLSVLCLGGTS